ncbi:MAG: Gfo/Idh/MocA family oxidoreductase, partial [Ignavibacteria bacterium]|nr:Gfo/Idh/MocA family oxidoreductase [Ignavibacteria bacterium]
MIRIGILGTARIARAFTGYPMDGIVVEAVASRDGGRAKAFADEFGIPQRYDSYDLLIDSETIDAVYIPLPPHLHCEYAVKAARAGKHILMEKPAAASAAEVERIQTACAQHRVHFMEGLMYRFMAIHNRAKEILASGTIGTLRYIDFNFCFDIVHRGRVGYRTNRNEGGGALLDLGVYAVDFLRFMTAKEPELLNSWMIEKEVDEFIHAVYRIGDVVATVTCSFISDANY